MASKNIIEQPVKVTYDPSKITANMGDNGLFPVESFEDFECTIGSSKLLVKYGVNQEALIGFCSKIIAKGAEIDKDGKKKGARLIFVLRASVVEAIGLEALGLTMPLFTMRLGLKTNKQELLAFNNVISRDKTGAVILDKDSKAIWLNNQPILPGLGEAFSKAAQAAAWAIANDISGKPPMVFTKRAQR